MAENGQVFYIDGVPFFNALVLSKSLNSGL